MSLLLLLPSLQFDNLVDAQNALPVVHRWRLAAPSNWCTLCSCPCQYCIAGADDDVGLEAGYTDSRRGGELHLMAVAQFQEQLKALVL